MAERREPRNVVDNIHNLIAQTCRLLCRGQLFTWFLIGGAHANKPLIYETEGERSCATPAVRVTVRDLFTTQQAAALLQRCEDRIGNSEPILAAELVKTLKVGTTLINWRDHRKAFRNAESVVLAATRRGDVHDARPLLSANITPRDHPVRGAIRTECCGYRWCGIERCAIAPSHELTAGLGIEDLGARGASAECGDSSRGANPQLASVKLHKFIGERRIHRGRDVGWDRPRCRRPR